MEARGRRAAGLGLGTAAVAALLVTCTACGSLPKPLLEQRLHALPKNAPIAELSRLETRADLGHGEEPLEVVYVHVPARGGAGEDRTPVVLVHGTPSTLFTWVEVIHGGDGFPGLAAERDVYALEVVGHGVAPGDASPCTFERCARFVGAAIRALGLERVHLVGQSYGGEFAWRAALNEPGLVRSLTLVDSSGLARREGDWLPEEVQMRENGLAKLGWILNSPERIESALAPHYDAIPPDRVEEFFLVCENATNWRAMVDLARDENGDREDELAMLRVPTLVLWGADDVAYPLDYYGERFAREIPGARLLAMPDTGHYPHEQRPAEFVRALGDFLDSVEADR